MFASKKRYNNCREPIKPGIQAILSGSKELEE
jgi:hypothetical protein